MQFIELKLILGLLAPTVSFLFGGLEKLYYLAALAMSWALHLPVAKDYRYRPPLHLPLDVLFTAFGIWLVLMLLFHGFDAYVDTFWNLF